MGFNVFVGKKLSETRQKAFKCALGSAQKTNQNLLIILPTIDNYKNIDNDIEDAITRKSLGLILKSTQPTKLGDIIAERTIIKTFEKNNSKYRNYVIFAIEPTINDWEVLRKLNQIVVATEWWSSTKSDKYNEIYKEINANITPT
ncbi:hypothetical protein [Thorsellia kenyensis]|uniref:Uncharacterized protein n=1 Tax=Thorsellia kenyensis TaxID=1549888 RepID=A0ABV6C7Q0_9GAMM